MLAIDNITVGMVPLALTPFNQAKSYIKGLEFAARGVPFVAWLYRIAGNLVANHHRRLRLVSFVPFPATS